MKMIIVTVFCLLLTACGIFDSQDVVYKPVPVQTVVSVPCRIPEIAVPAMPTSSITDKSTMFQQVTAMGAEIKIRNGYEAMLTASIKACQ